MEEKKKKVKITEPVEVTGSNEYRRVTLEINGKEVNVLSSTSEDSNCGLSDESTDIDEEDIKKLTDEEIQEVEDFLDDFNWYPETGNTTINIKDRLNEFLEERKDRFQNVTDKQKEIWIKSLEADVKGRLNDNDIFYDNMPEDVEEN